MTRVLPACTHHPSTVCKTVQYPLASLYDESTTLRHIAPPVPAVAFPVRQSTIMPGNGYTRTR
jgi:hypothetical protein